MPPQEKFSDLLRSFLVPFWGEIARVGWPTAVFEAFKHSQNLKAWFCFTLQRLQSSCEVREKYKKTLASYHTHSVTCVIAAVKLRSVWLVCISSVGSSVHSYVCTDLLSIHEGSPSKREFHGNSMEPMEPL